MYPKKTFQVSTISTNSLLDIIEEKSPMVDREVDYGALCLKLYKALRRLIEHEATGKWTQAPFPHSKALGCQYCEQEWKKHAPDCLINRLNRFIKDIEVHFPKNL